MANSVLVTIVLTLFVSFDGCFGGRRRPPYIAYNSSDLSYLSNGIQFPVPKSDEVDPIIEELGDEELPEMEWMARLYNHHKWDQYLQVLSNDRCRSDMSYYLMALNNGTTWAAKSQLYSFL